MNLEKDAHKYLVDKGCLNMGQKYTAIEVKKMLVDFAEEQVKLYSQTPVSNQRELLIAYELKLWINPTQNQIEMAEQVVDMYLRN
jgi:hypothetical protein